MGGRRQDAASFATAAGERRVCEPRRRGGSGARRSARKQARPHIPLGASCFRYRGRAGGGRCGFIVEKCAPSEHFFAASLENTTPPNGVGGADPISHSVGGVMDKTYKKPLHCRQWYYNTLSCICQVEFFRRAFPRFAYLIVCYIIPSVFKK